MSYYGAQRRRNVATDIRGSNLKTGWRSPANQNYRKSGVPQLRLDKLFRKNKRGLRHEFDIVYRYYRRSAYRRLLGRNPATKVLSMVAEDLLDQVFQYRAPKAERYWSPSGADYEYHCYPTAGDFVGWNSGSSGPINNVYKCLVGQVPNGEMPEGQPFGWTDNRGHQLRLGPAVYIGAGSRMTFAHIFSWDAKGGVRAKTVQYDAPKPAAYSVALPNLYIGKNPMENPLGGMAIPVRVPYPLLPRIPRQSPWPYGSKGEEPSLPRYTRFNPREDVLAQPGISATTGGAVSRAPAHEYSPPDKTERERKGQLKGMAAKLKGFADYIGGTWMEAADYIDAAYGAMGYYDKAGKWHAKGCPGARTPQAKMACLIAHPDRIDLSTFAYNLVMNEVEDRVLGAIGKVNRKASQKVFRDQRGFQTGSSAKRLATGFQLKQ